MQIKFVPIWNDDLPFYAWPIYIFVCRSRWSVCKHIFLGWTNRASPSCDFPSRPLQRLHLCGKCANLSSSSQAAPSSNVIVSVGNDVDIQRANSCSCLLLFVRACREIYKSFPLSSLYTTVNPSRGVSVSYLLLRFAWVRREVKCFLHRERMSRFADLTDERADFSLSPGAKSNIRGINISRVELSGKISPQKSIDGICVNFAITDVSKRLQCRSHFLK